LKKEREFERKQQEAANSGRCIIAWTKVKSSNIFKRKKDRKKDR